MSVGRPDSIRDRGDGGGGCRCLDPEETDLETGCRALVGVRPLLLPPAAAPVPVLVYADDEARIVSDLDMSLLISAMSTCRSRG